MKDFNDFRDKVNQEELLASISKKRLTNADDLAKLIAAIPLISIDILGEYHKWLHTPDEQVPD